MENINVKEKVYYIVLGFLGFSILGQYIILNVLKFPVMVIEIFYLPLLLNIIKNKKLRFTAKITYSELFIILILSLSIGITIIKTNDINSLFNYRSIIYLLICLKIFSKRDISISKLYWISLGAIYAEIFFTIFISQNDIVSSSNCIAIALIIIIPFIQKRYIISIINVIICFFYSINTGFRIGIIITIIAVLEILIFLIFYKKILRTIKGILYFPIILLILFYVSNLLKNNYIQIVEFIAELTGMSTFAKFRVTEKLQGLFSGNLEVSQDIGRIYIYLEGLKNYFNSIIPKGLIGEAQGFYFNYIDVPITYLGGIFGNIISIIFIVKIIIRYCKVVYKKVDNYKLNYQYTQEKILIILAIPILLVLFIVNGSFFVIVYQAIMTGMILGLLFKDRRFI